MSRCRVTVALVVLAWGVPSSPDVPGTLDVSWTVDGTITATALAVWGASELTKDALAPPACRWCSTDGLDARVRNAVLWSNTAAARRASDILVVGLPAGVAAYELLAARDAASGARDALVVAEAVAVTGVLTQASKYAFARVRALGLLQRSGQQPRRPPFVLVGPHLGRFLGGRSRRHGGPHAP